MMSLSELFQQAVVIIYIIQNDVLSVQFPDAVAVGIHDAGVVQKLRGRFHIEGERVLQRIIAIF